VGVIGYALVAAGARLLGGRDERHHIDWLVAVPARVSRSFAAVRETHAEVDTGAQMQSRDPKCRVAAISEKQVSG